MTFIDRAEAHVRSWQEPGEFLRHASQRRGGLAEGPYTLVGFGCGKVGYQLPEPIVWNRETLAGFEGVLARRGLAPEYGLYAHGKGPAGLELLTVKDIGSENALYVDRRLPGNKEKLVDELTEVLTVGSDEAVPVTRLEVEEGWELVGAIEEFVDRLRSEEDFLAVARKRDQAPGWQRLRFAGFACGKMGVELPVDIRWSRKVLDEYERLLGSYNLRAAYGVYAHGKTASQRLDVLVVHDVGPRSAVYLHRRFPRRGMLLMDLLTLFKS